ncbi:MULTISPECIES: hypothetical protein [unclassified Pseudomonas]|uniref:hypothetical protein n=1 Tax=unclassified Pseudomonas TaxID=196821 RepID=UPI0011AFA627|nr:MULTISPECIES: hypothetical protein [unclassified Pseudomonas]
MSLVDGHPSWASTSVESDKPRKGRDTGGGDPPGGDPLEARVIALEKASQDIRDKLVRVELRLDTIESNMAAKTDLALLASKDDLTGFVRASGKDVQDLAVSFQKSITDVQKTINEQTWKFIGLAGVLAGLAFTAAKFIN